MSPLPAPGFSPPYLLSLNDVALIVLPRSVTKLEHDCVIQIFIKSEHKSPNVGVLATFFLRQRELTDVIMKLVTAYVQASRTPPAKLTIDGDECSLIVETHKWAYGRTLDLRWGEDKLVPCSHKWVITFQADN